ncbi:hypothetical protein PMKS-002086 [Pichia membranifaciens]|uniref:PH domain-containing protein n=1 Tax=Pichia membranifaciens TaxID=4926 RepID=A0A1Q2YGV1_9ASCO|nr:hypothetical protein PMKS-002086 [Pichia membranifaciens]
MDMSQGVVDYNTIHKHLKQLKFAQTSASGSASQLDEQTAIKYVSTLRQELIALTSASNSPIQINSKTLNEILIFTKTLDYVPKSDKLFSLFDAQLFRSLFDLACLPEIPVEVLRGVLRICLTYLAGVLPKTRKQGMFRVLLGVLCERVEDPVKVKSTASGASSYSHVPLKCDILFANLTARITFADARMNLNIVDFVAKVFYRLMETISLLSNESSPLIVEEQWLFGVVRSLFVNNFFGVLSCIKGIGEIEGMTGLRGSMELTSKWLENKKLDSTNFIWQECCFLASEIGVVLGADDLAAINNASDTDKTDGNRVGILSILGLVGALEQPKRSLKKILVECNMTSTLPIIQFVSTIARTISKSKILDRIFGVWNTELWYSLLNVGTRCWLFSGARVEAGDIDKVVSLVEVVITWLSRKLESNADSRSQGNSNSENVTKIAKDDIEISDSSANDCDVVSLLEKVDSFDYNEIKLLQLENVRSKHFKKWANNMKPFENLVHRQVVALVRAQRFLQLSKGSWVYATNPLEAGEHHHLFLTLNSNSQSIVYKEFSKRPWRNSQAPNLDKDGIYIEFRDILAIESENLNPNISDTGLISIQSERMDVNRVEVITKTKIFQFYVDTKQLRDIWVDGLRILVTDSRSDTKAKDHGKESDSSPMKLSISEEFFLGSGVSEEVKKQVRTLEEIRVRTQMLDLDDNAKPLTKRQPEFVEWNTISTNFHYE